MQVSATLFEWVWLFLTTPTLSGWPLPSFQQISWPLCNSSSPTTHSHYVCTCKIYLSQTCGIYTNNLACEKIFRYGDRTQITDHTTFNTMVLLLGSHHTGNGELITCSLYTRAKVNTHTHAKMHFCNSHSRAFFSLCSVPILFDKQESWVWLSWTFFCFSRFLAAALTRSSLTCRASRARSSKPLWVILISSLALLTLT